MKKWLAFVLVFVFAFTLVGCKEKKPSDKNGDKQKDLTDLEKFWQEERPDFGGMTIKIMAAGHALHEHDPFEDAYAGLDKEAKQQAWEKIEQVFNIKLEVVAYDDAAPWGPQRIAYINDVVNREQPDAHFYTIASEWIPQFVRAGSIVDLEDAYANYGRAYMDSAVKQALSFGNRLYAISNDKSTVDNGFFYNYRLLKDLELESPAKIFNEGNWTYERFVEYITDAQNKLAQHFASDENKAYAIAGEPVYIFTGMVNAAGIKLMDVDNLKLNLLDPVAEQAMQALRQIGELGAIDPAGGYDATNENFKAGKALFSHGGLWFINADNRWLNVWGEGETEWGFVPYPRPANVDKDDTRTAYPGSQSYVIPQNLQLPEGITEVDVYRIMVDLYKGTELYQQEDPDYDEEILREVRYQTLVDDEHSVTALLFLDDGRVFFDPLATTAPHYNTGLGSAIRTLTLSGGDFRETLEPIVDRITNDFLLPSWG